MRTYTIEELTKKAENTINLNTFEIFIIIYKFKNNFLNLESKDKKFIWRYL